MSKLTIFLDGLDCPIDIKKPCEEPKEQRITITGPTVDMTDFWSRFYAGKRISLSLECTDYDDEGNMEAKIV